jgi:hypothetical protein
MLGGDVHFTGAGSSALVSIARGNTPLKVVVAPTIAYCNGL